MLVAYHGSDHKFTEFSFKKMGQGSGTTGAGFGLYFSSLKADALGYGPYVYTCNLELENNLSNNSLTLNKKMVKVFLDCLRDTHGKDYYECFDYNENDAIISLLENETDTDLVGDIVNATSSVNEMLDVLTKYGYTHTIDIDTPEIESTTHYVVYDLSAIKIVETEKF